MKVEYDFLKQHFHLFLLRIERGDVFRRRTGKCYFEIPLVVEAISHNAVHHDAGYFLEHLALVHVDHIAPLILPDENFGTVDYKCISIRRGVFPSESVALLVIHLAPRNHFLIEHSEMLGLYEIALHRLHAGSNSAYLLPDLCLVHLLLGRDGRKA